MLFPDARVVGDKWPAYIFFLDRLTTLSDMSAVVVFRDCRDGVSSFLVKLRTDWRNLAWTQQVNTVEKIAQLWVDSINLMEAKADQLFIIKYKDLVQHPESVLNAFGAWLDLDPTGFAKGIIRDTSLGKYEAGLSKDDLATVMNVAGPTMARYGYV